MFCPRHKWSIMYRTFVECYNWHNKGLNTDDIVYGKYVRISYDNNRIQTKWINEKKVSYLTHYLFPEVKEKWHGFHFLVLKGRQLSINYTCR